MSEIPIKILMIEDSEDDALLLLRDLKRNGFLPDCKRIDNKQAMEKALDQDEWQIIISDYNLPNFNGKQALELVKKKGLDVPFIIISGEVSDEDAVFMLKEGAHDYINKNNLTRLIPAIQRELSEAETRRKEKESQIALRKSKDLLDHFLHSATDSFFLFNENLELIELNDSGKQLIPNTTDSFLGKKLKEICPFTNKNSIMELITKVMASGNPVQIEIEELEIGGERVFFILKAFKVQNGLGIILTNISNIKLAQEQVQKSLKEKEILLSEIHHRVKNNMQVITSLLTLQNASINDIEARKKIDESIARILSISLVHEKLYKSKNLSDINFENYVVSLTDQLYSIYNIDKQKICLTINMDSNINFDIVRAIPCGLIANELISNMFKHAFPKDSHGNILIQLLRDGKNIVFELKDDGKGIPFTDLNGQGTLGLSLVDNLVKQIESEIQIDNLNGTTFRITIPDK